MTATVAYDDVEVGNELPAQTFPIRRADLVRYAGASGDFNVIHWNERVATSVGLPDVIAHGMSRWPWPPGSSPTGPATPGASSSTASGSPARCRARRRRGRDGRGDRHGRREARRRPGAGRPHRDARRREGARPAPRRSSQLGVTRAHGARRPPRRPDHPAPRRPGRRLVIAETDDEVVDAVRDADAAGEPLLVLGGGSNLVVGRRGLRRHRRARRDPRASTVATASPSTRSRSRPARPGTTSWRSRSTRGYSGVEALSGIPGRVGATPIQNVGAYGQEVAQTIARGARLDRSTGEVVDAGPPRECGFGYRTSVFKRPGPVRRALRHVRPRHARDRSRRSGTPSWPAPSASRSAPRAAGRTSATRCSSCAAARAWCSTRRTTTRGAPARSSPTRCSARRRDRLPPDAPRWPQRDGLVKTSAAWLIEQAGFAKGYGTGQARISTKHTLALTNRGGATTAELLALAREVRTAFVTASA